MLNSFYIFNIQLNNSEGTYELDYKLIKEYNQ